ncbi:MAG TPA: hypothetical protein VF737_08920, partial [Gemmatimonadaceae bacterium]
NVQSVIGKLNNLDKFVQAGDTTDAQAQANNIVSFVQMKATQGTLPGTPQQIDAFIGGVLCYAGLSPNTFLIQPTDSAQVLATNTGQSGVSLQAHTVTVPTLLTITELDPNGPSGLDTKLDQYPTYISVSFSSQLIDSAVVAVCIPSSLGVPQAVFDRLRLGHQATTGFEITPPADPSFLNCPSAVASTSRMPGWLRKLASLVLPKPLYAGTMMYATGGVGGSAINFSPFGAVDNGLYATGGVGGAAVNFQRMPSLNRGSTSTPSGGSTQKSGSGTPSYSVYDASGNCISSDTTVGTALNTLCRPVVTIKTAKGTIMTGVPVGWAVTSGGGTIASDTLVDNACGPFSTAVNNATDVNGQAGVCWTLGPNAGTNTVTATPTFGGDAPAGVVFLDGSGATESGVQFTATADLIPTTATATGDTTTYDGLAHAGSGICSNSLTPALTYNTTGGSAPVDAGPYTLIVTCGAGSTVYKTSTDTATILIRPAVPVVTVACPDSIAYTGSPLTPCTATVKAPNLNLTPTPTYSANTGVGFAVATVNFAATRNYAAAKGTTSFRITKATSAVAVSCPATVPYSAGANQTPCTASASGAGGLSAALTVTYAPTPLHDAGSYTASAVFAGDTNHYGSSGSATFAVTKLTATATAGSGTMLYGGSVPVLPCTVTGLLTPDAGAVACTTAAPATLLPGLNTTTPVVSPAAPANYHVTPVNGTLAVHYVQSSCFASPIYSSQPPTKSYQKLGSKLPIKCTLLTATGTAVTNATGNLTVTDMGTSGSGPGVVVFRLTNAFSQDSNKNYSYGFNTSILTSGHFYIVTAVWNDGSTTIGWFYVK